MSDMEHFFSPESTSITGATYDETMETLTITFKRGGGSTATYSYDNFPQTAEKGGSWEGFKAAASKGDYFQRNIRSSFIGKTVKAGKK